jgi:hypothetical protein
MRSKRAATKAGVSCSTIKAQLKLPEGDSRALDPEDGRQPIFKESGAFHAQETGGYHYQGGRDHQMVVCAQYYVKLCKQSIFLPSLYNYYLKNRNFKFTNCNIILRENKSII